MIFLKQSLTFTGLSLTLLGLASISYQSLIDRVNIYAYLLLVSAFICFSIAFLIEPNRTRSSKIAYLQKTLLFANTLFIVGSLINNLAPDRSLLSWLKIIPSVVIIIIILKPLRLSNKFKTNNGSD